MWHSDFVNRFRTVACPIRAIRQGKNVVDKVPFVTSTFVPAHSTTLKVRQPGLERSYGGDSLRDRRFSEPQHLKSVPCGANALLPDRDPPRAAGHSASIRGHCCSEIVTDSTPGTSTFKQSDTKPHAFTRTTHYYLLLQLFSRGNFPTRPSCLGFFTSEKNLSIR
ncbi:stationary phase survival protein SurE [Anopheles sinensis]|uniref:Stationary phase survival protein SurE n=1 Tax=Anopheles sinensis TaxID=74873 RepID=A0A084WJE5_ANOSI|nr:stationary phase survival protein SurE [Anopheles sinensis]